MDQQIRRIQRLDKEVAEQITSQQIIPTLHQCIKELVDNSIDAKATLIKIELNQYGKISFTVFDNGSGISQVQKLGEGRNTSKLKINQNTQQDYLQGVRTLGFRGQALNSIGHLCKDMIIHTVFQDISNQDLDNSYVETKYSISQRSVLENKKSVAKQTFTKIEVSGLFHTLPVRKHQLDNRPKQNIKRVYELVFEISLIFPEITFILANVVQGREQILFDIQRHNFGKLKQSQNNLDYFYEEIPKEAWKQRIQICFPNKLDNCLTFVKTKNLEGFILNTIDSGSSRKNLKFSKNFQFTFINRRPVNPIKEICRIFDGYYKKYNPYTKYVFFLNLKVEPNEIDVNLSPNKRDIFIKKQRLDEISKQIRNLIEKEVVEKIINLPQFKEAKMQNTLERSKKKYKEDQESQSNDRLKPIKNQSQKNSQQDSLNIRKQVFRANISQSVQQKSIKDNYLGNYRPILNQANSSAIEELNRRITESKLQSFPKKKSYHSVMHDNGQKRSETEKKKSYAPVDESQSEEQNSESEDIEKQRKETANVKQQDRSLINQVQVKDQMFKGLTNSIKLIEREETQKKANISIQTKNQVRSFNIPDSKIKRQEEQIHRHSCQNSSSPFKSNHPIKKQENPQIKDFQLPPNINYVTDQNRGDINKEDFKKFHIHGQFNKGFILCSFDQKDYLYIIDQHASQEKRLFESFMESKPQFYYLSKQVPITPLQVDQIETARTQLFNSGFTFVIENRSTLKIIRCPSFFKKHFGIEEFMQIVDTNKNIKEIPIFYNAAASKACRSAVMIGDELIRSKMIDIVHRMSDLKSPWNCPHGRPSLISLGSFKSIISKIKSPKPLYKF